MRVLLYCDVLSTLLECPQSTGCVTYMRQEMALNLLCDKYFIPGIREESA
jgi:hypothetical protein